MELVLELVLEDATEASAEGVFFWSANKSVGTNSEQAESGSVVVVERVAVQRKPGEGVGVDEVDNRAAREGQAVIPI